MQMSVGVESGQEEEEGHHPLRDPHGIIQCSKRFLFFGAFLIFIGSILLCGFGFTVVLPYKETSVWPETTCRVINALYSPNVCSCEQTYNEMSEFSDISNTASHSDHEMDKDGTKLEDAGDCMGTFPCLKILVTYLLTSEHTTTLRQHPLSSKRPSSLFRTWTDAFYNTCTLHECGDSEWNIKEVRRFRLKWGQPNITYPCYFNPAAPYQAILERFTSTQVIHAVVWPSLVLLAGTLIWLGLCMGCWTIAMDQNPHAPIDRTCALL